MSWLDFALSDSRSPLCSSPLVLNGLPYHVVTSAYHSVLGCQGNRHAEWTDCCRRYMNGPTFCFIFKAQFQGWWHKPRLNRFFFVPGSGGGGVRKLAINLPLLRHPKKSKFIDGGLCFSFVFFVRFAFCFSSYVQIWFTKNTFWINSKTLGILWSWILYFAGGKVPPPL